MKNTILTIFATLCIIVCANVAYAQIIRYEEHTTIDELRVEYRWQRERFFVRDSNAVLNLQLTNLTESYLKVSFVVAYYRDEKIFFESEDNSLCLRPGQRIRGGRAGLRFVADDVLRAEIDEENFAWDILFSEISEVRSCE